MDSIKRADRAAFFLATKRYRVHGTKNMLDLLWGQGKSAEEAIAYLRQHCPELISKVPRAARERDLTVDAFKHAIAKVLKVELKRLSARRMTPECADLFKDTWHKVFDE